MSQSDWPTQLGLIEERSNFWSQILATSQMSQLLTELELQFLSRAFHFQFCEYIFPILPLAACEGYFS